MGLCANIPFNYLCCSLANVDPIDVAKNITGLNPETTLGKYCEVKLSSFVLEIYLLIC